MCCNLLYDVFPDEITHLYLTLNPVRPFLSIVRSLKSLVTVLIHYYCEREDQEAWTPRTCVRSTFQWMSPFVVDTENFPCLRFIVIKFFLLHFNADAFYLNGSLFWPFNIRFYFLNLTKPHSLTKKKSFFKN